MSEEYVNAAASPAQREVKATLGFVVSPSDVSDSSVTQTIALTVLSTLMTNKESKRTKIHYDYYVLYFCFVLH